jgi:hypothetical protein
MFDIEARAGAGRFPGIGCGRSALLFLPIKEQLLHFQAGGGLVVAPQDSEVLIEAAQVAQFDAESRIVAAVPAGEGVPFAIGVGQFGGFGEQILAGLPVEEAGLAPFMEILLTDRLAGKVAGQEGFDIGGGIEPIEKGGVVLVPGEAAVEFIAPGARETGDFTFAGHNSLVNCDCMNCYCKLN